MSHYFSTDSDTQKSNPIRIAFRAHGTDFECQSDHGVFARSGLDRGTRVLLDALHVEEGTRTALDLGCGYGPIGLVLSKVYQLNVDLVDVNPRAVRLAIENLRLNHTEARVIEGDAIGTIDGSYDLIVTNPPIRIGKEGLYALLAWSHDHLNPGGTFWFVIHKQHGAQSALRYIATVYDQVDVVDRSKGFHVVRCRK
jgi:16S rRNA (guanine1207-N2)-methyltransferase